MRTLQQPRLIFGFLASLGCIFVQRAPAACLTPPTGLVSWWQAEGDGQDQSGGNTATLLSGATFGAGEVGQAFSFNGSSAYLSVPASPSLDLGSGTGFTIECWINPADVASTHVIVEWNNGSGGLGVHMYHSDPGIGGLGALAANVRSAGGGDRIFASAPHLVTAGTFQHVALTYDTTIGQPKFFYNGVAATSQNMGSFTPQTTYPLYFGKRISGAAAVGSYYSGQMDEIAFYSRALADSEILAIYNAGSAGKCSGPVPPTIYLQPSNQVAGVGANVNFQVGASGSGPLAYQWTMIGTNIVGATNPSLTLANVQLADSGSYAVQVTNAYGSITSTDAVLTVVVQPPSIVTQPLSQNVAVGSDVSLSVTATGTAPLSYQWSKDGNDLPGATAATFTLTNVQTNDSGSYALVVTNAYGAATSSVAVVTVTLLATSFFDDLDPDIDFPQWAGFGGTVLATNYGGSVSAPNSLWFGGDGLRFATTKPLNTSSGGNVQSYLRIANGAGYPWEMADLPGEGIVLEYSTTGGSNWVQMGRFDTSAYTSWTNIALLLPGGAQAPSTQFRWRQLSNSGYSFDHWALDN